MRQHRLGSRQVIQIVKGDITEEKTDAIVNAANSYLQHGGGVAGAISLKGGPVIQDESDDWVESHGPVTHSSPAITHAGKLPCHFIIHAVGPIWGEGEEDDKLGEAVRGSLHQADNLDLASISFPAISTGIFGFPVERAAGVILSTIGDYFQHNSDSCLQKIRVVLFDSKTLQAFETEFIKVFLDQTS